MDKIIINIKSIFPFKSGAHGPRRGKEMKELESIENGFISFNEGKISGIGLMEEINLNGLAGTAEVIDARGQFALPCFVDSHTHVVFAEPRHTEFVDRIKGLTYEEIALRGGGILNSAKKLQESSEEKLYLDAMARLEELMVLGTGSIEIKTSSNEQSAIELDSNSEDVLTRHLLKLSEVEDQFRQLTNKFEEINFKLDKLSNRLSKIQADNQIRFQDIETVMSSGEVTTKLTSKPKVETNEVLPGSSQPQDLGSISYKDTETSETSQKIESVDTTASVVTETFQAEEKILPQDLTPKKQYEFATSFLKVGDYSTAERAFREFVLSNSEHELAGSAQYWYAETFRIRQLYTDAASAYLEGYQKYPKGNKAPINLLKLGVSMVQIGEKDQGCKMINGVQLQYPKANQSVIQKAKYESKKFECIKEDS